ncbi:MAG: hypothetical protein A3F41_07355 [Coxiella sp. RIFCSPHIGHO2_12_FULL_44_14]|nr:MAG: hypothetical protein A3F41_07355 [Coxiella sp. RIFCSPHIGHO2_12_FULL_44_14]
MASIKYLCNIGLTIATTALLYSTSLAAPTNADTFTPAQQKSIEKIIHHYLVQHPEVLLEASIKLRENQGKQQEQQALQAVAKVKTALFDDPNSPTAGNPNGNEVLVEFFDYQCPHCKSMIEPIKKLIAKNKNLKVVFKDWPIFGGSSETAARAAIAADKQGKYLELHDALLKADNPLTDEKIMDLAKSVGCDLIQLQKDMNSAATDNVVKSNFKVAQALDLQGTPAFVLTNKTTNNYKFIPGQTTEENLQKLLDQLNKK